MKNYIRVETVQINGKWYVQVVNGEDFSLRVGARLQAAEEGYFVNDLPDSAAAFHSRGKARAALRAYKDSRPWITVVGGLH